MSLRALSALRAVLFAFAVHVLSIFNMVLYAEGVTKDITSLLLQIVLLVILAPLYFFVKGKTSRPWLYLLLTCCAHIVLCFVGWVALRFVYQGWEIAAFYWAEIFVSVFFGAVIIFDMVFMLARAHLERRAKKA